MAEENSYQGSCHCGAVRFTAVTTLDQLIDCNCSRCRRLGWVMKAVPATHFTLHAGDDVLTLYRFNTEHIEHLFCKVCGIESFARGKGPDGAATYMVNVHCLDGASFDPESVMHFNGAER